MNSGIRVESWVSSLKEIPLSFVGVALFLWGLLSEGHPKARFLASKDGGGFGRSWESGQTRLCFLQDAQNLIFSITLIPSSPYPGSPLIRKRQTKCMDEVFAAQAAGVRSGMR